jgi:hypothetical protein
MTSMGCDWVHLLVGSPVGHGLVMGWACVAPRAAAPACSSCQLSALWPPEWAAPAAAGAWQRRTSPRPRWGHISEGELCRGCPWGDQARVGEPAPAGSDGAVGAAASPCYLSEATMNTISLIFVRSARTILSIGQTMHPHLISGHHRDLMVDCLAFPCFHSFQLSWRPHSPHNSLRCISEAVHPICRSH